ncbi:biopolymer transporter ExbB [Paracoccus liaowanqingii]|uniref:Biopolymer transporter ExbB n=1 Tax=Paracoccus liaowanqingii TaxID=2560053 RepID=A0A4P7HS30_9RHOB|nr:biopolymer transporter ExbB [Paracoccus liaowanqingii]QBX36181.1 biopolymer transporter ExbB [Paracoccus liaowanqingii]
MGAGSAPRFSQPVRQILMMLTVLGLVLAGGWFAYGRILPIFMANTWLNGLILGVFALGVLACFWQLGQLVRSVVWIEQFAARRRDAARPEGDSVAAPRLLAPLAALLGSRGPSGGAISASSASSILDSVATRIDEIRDITRYLANLLIFLGLLGTFYGLATTVPAVVETIRALAPQDGQTSLDIFEQLMTGLEAQLGGMATAFSSSLLGLAGSLVVGLLELFVAHGQNRFYRELEEWMSGFTRLSIAGGEGDGVDQAALAGFLEQMAGQMDRLQAYHTDRDVMRDEAALMADERVVVMAQAIDALVQQAQSEREAAAVEGDRLTRALTRLADGQDRQPAAQQAPDFSRLEGALDRLASELTEGREEMLAELRSDILVLTRAVRAARFGDALPDDLPPQGASRHRSGA